VESDYGGGGAHISEMHILICRSGRIDCVVRTRALRTGTRNAEEFTLTLDVARSRQRKGAKFCFVKTAYMETLRSHAPRVSNVCMPTRDNLK
jgi:hypothetical protein